MVGSPSQPRRLRLHRHSRWLVRVPLARQFYAWRGLLELEDGTLLLSLYGNSDGDQVRIPNPLAPLEDGYLKNRVIIVASTDRGSTWSYRCTLSYHPGLGNEGQNESDLIQLPTGDLLAVPRLSK